MATSERMIKSRKRANLGTYWAQRPAYGHSELHPAAHGKIRPQQSLPS
jgi:hypothetical protein